MAANAIKHGFNTKEEPYFSVSIKKDLQDNTYTLTILNTGNPFPEKISLKNPETTGLQLVSSLVQQLDGTIELLQREPHPVFVIKFPVKE